MEFRHSMRNSTVASTGPTALWKPLKTAGWPGVRPGTSWKAPTKVLSTPLIRRARCWAPVRGEAALLAAEAPPEPTKPSQGAADGGPLVGVGVWKAGLGGGLGGGGGGGGQGQGDGGDGDADG